MSVLHYYPYTVLEVCIFCWLSFVLPLGKKKKTVLAVKFPQAQLFFFFLNKYKIMSANSKVVLIQTKKHKHLNFWKGYSTVCYNMSVAVNSMFIGFVNTQPNIISYGTCNVGFLLWYLDFLRTLLKDTTIYF